MAFTLRFMPKTLLQLPGFKTYLQQPRKMTMVYRGPQRKKESSGKGGKIHGEEMNSINNSQISIKDQINEMKRETKESDSSAKKAKTSI